MSGVVRKTFTIGGLVGLSATVVVPATMWVASVRKDAPEVTKRANEDVRAWTRTLTGTPIVVLRDAFGGAWDATGLSDKDVSINVGGGGATSTTVPAQPGGTELGPEFGQ